MSSVNPVDNSELKILVVEDNEQAVRLLKKMLSGIGIRHVFVFFRGHAALEYFRDNEQGIDVILCDWNLPDISGLEILREIRKSSKDIPFLMVTGATDPKSVMQAKTDGVTGYLVKPYSIADLKKKIRLIQRVLAARAP